MNEYEARGRALKAFRIARVLRRVVDEDPRLDPDRLADPALTTPDIRARVAALARCHPPSELTWAQAIDLLRAWVGDETR